ncbi:hypothetical protein BGZ63DRAFT_394668 [Mariannaea sp. PMI_226]|nr:hypothetical protein BGZ63DRAFT_394668 [Mariannaea sp. PMI_226]
MLPDWGKSHFSSHHSGEPDLNATPFVEWRNETKPRHSVTGHQQRPDFPICRF